MLDRMELLWQQSRMSESILKFFGSLKELALYLLRASSSAEGTAELLSL